MEILSFEDFPQSSEINNYLWIPVIVHLGYTAKIS